MENGVGFYIFDDQHRLLLLKKKDSKVDAKDWLVPGTITDVLPDLNELIKNETEKLNLLSKDVDLARFVEGPIRYVGNWLHTPKEQSKAEVNFANFIVRLNRVSSDEWQKLKDITLTSAGTNINEIEFFPILGLPKNIFYVTSSFLKSLLFHKPPEIRTPIGDNADALKQFDNMLGNDAHKYFVFRRIEPGGGYGDIYSVVDIASLEGKIIKLARPNLMDPKWAQRCIAEGTTLLYLLLQDLDPSIEKMYSINRVETIEKESRYYLVKNLVNGKTLQELNPQKLSDDAIIDIIHKIVTALKKMHSLKYPVVHRDIKPNNIMVLPEDNEDKIKDLTIIDFGLSKSKQVTVGTSSTDYPPGNPTYQSIDTIRHYKTHNAIDDYYSVAHIFYWLIFGQSFYKNMHFDDIRYAKKQRRDKFLDKGQLKSLKIDQNRAKSFDLLKKFLSVIRKYYRIEPMRTRKKNKDKTVREIQSLFSKSEGLNCT